MPQRYDVCIVGGGITGLAAAYYLERISRQSSVSYAILEASAAFGGKIQTDQLRTPDGEFLLEKGPDSFLTQKPWALQLAKALCLEEELIPINADARGFCVLKRGRPQPILPFLLSPVISPLGKLRMGLEPFVPHRKDISDESVAQFARRRLGQEAFDYLAEPLMSGIFSADPEQQSMQATFPRFLDIERQHKSLLLRMRRGGQDPSFLSYRNGMGTLVKTLVKTLQGRQTSSCGVEMISLLAPNKFQVLLKSGERVECSRLLLTVPAASAATMLPANYPALRTKLQELRTTSSGCIYLSFANHDIRRVLTGTGLVIPRVERRAINAITYVSSKFPGRAPEGQTLLRVFFGGSRNPKIMHQNDEAIAQIALQELESLLGIAARPSLSQVYRYQNGNPQYDVGHVAKSEALMRALPDGLFLAGSSYRGGGIPDCIYEGQRIAEKINASL